MVEPAGVDRLLFERTKVPASIPLMPEAFLRRNAYAPLLRLVRAATGPAVNRVTEIAHGAATISTRHLVLRASVPRAGKTLVGPQHLIEGDSGLFSIA